MKNIKNLIKQKTDIVQIVREYGVQLANHHKGLCPFHDDHNPSFSVVPEKQYFNCFACGKAGDVIQFVQLKENVGFIEALKILSRKCNIPFPELSSKDSEYLSKYEKRKEVLLKTTLFYYNHLTDNVKDYLINERKLNQEIINEYKIGFANGRLRDHLLNECQFSKEDCIEVGVLNEDDNGQIKDHFYNRIIIPNFRCGEVVYLIGRSIDQNKRKYLNLEGEIKYLFNEDCLNRENVFITEGAIDCLTAIQHGYNSVGLLGARTFKDEYIEKFKNCKKIYICFDGDKAGRNGSIDIANKLIDKAKIISLPDGLDLNEYFKSYSEDDFNVLIEQAKDIIEYKINQIDEDINKLDLYNELNPIMQKLSLLDNVKIETYLKHYIKTKFELDNKDIEGYRKIIFQYKRNNNIPIVNSNIDDDEIESVKNASFDGLIDIAEYQGESVFLIKEKDKLIIKRDHKSKDGQILIPPAIEKLPFKLVRADKVIELFNKDITLPEKDVNRDLYNSLLKYHKSVAELPSDEFYDLIVTWDLHTYLLENVQYTPVICLFATPERGKTRLGKSMLYLSYRGIYTVSLRDAYIIRIAENLGATIFFDVMDIWRVARENQCVDVLLQRFEKGVKVPRVNRPDKPAFDDIDYYSTFGATIISTNRDIHNILGTRAITINMPESDRKFNNEVVFEDALPLKERLTSFRARYYKTKLAKIDKPANGRLGDILRPLKQMILLVNPERESVFNKLVEQIKKRKISDSADTLDVIIFNIIISLKDKLQNGNLLIQDIKDEYNGGKDDREKYSSQRIGRIVKALGFEKVRINRGNSAIIWNEQLIERLKMKYGIDNPSEMSETSLINDDTEVSEVSDEDIPVVQTFSQDKDDKNGSSDSPEQDKKPECFTHYDPASKKCQTCPYKKKCEDFFGLPF